jgi:porphobilinogen synthase
MDPSNRREAVREMKLDLLEGADVLMVKPAGPYLDIVADARRAFDVPLAAYQVSGEYSLIQAGARLGWLDERSVALESLTGIKRAGADLILTYFAPRAARWLQEP